MTRKQNLITDIQNLLNTHENINPTSIDANLLDFMDEETLINIIDSLLKQKELSTEPDKTWLNTFKLQEY